MLSRRSVCALSATAVLVLTGAPVGAFSGEGELNRDVLEVHGTVYAPPGEPTATPTREVGSRPLLRREVLPAPPARTGSLEGACLLQPTPTPPELPWGFRYHVTVYTPAGDIVREEDVCVPFPDGDVTATPPPPVFAVLPTIAEAWASAALPHPSITTDPATRGITGLETRITTTGPTSLTISADVRGYVITGTATLDHYTIAIDNGPAKNADHDTFVFETKGKHAITVAAVWRGSATIVGNEIVEPIVLPDIGTATTTSTRVYQVNEIRSVLQP